MWSNKDRDVPCITIDGRSGNDNSDSCGTGSGQSKGDGFSGGGHSQELIADIVLEVMIEILSPKKVKITLVNPLQKTGIRMSTGLFGTYKMVQKETGSLQLKL